MAPSSVRPRTKVRMARAVEALRQPAVSKFFWNFTFSDAARPTCVWVLPMSRRSSMLFSQSDVSANDPFQTAVLSADQQCAFGIERFRAPMDNARAGRNFNGAPERGAIFLPFIGDGLEITGSKLKIIAVEFAENGGSDLGALE